MRPSDHQVDSESRSRDANSSRRKFLAAGLVAAPAAAFVATRSAAAQDFRGFNLREFRNIRTHENDHVDFLVNALGNAARPKPTFRRLRQTNVNQFVELSRVLENTGVGAYLGAAPFIFSRSNLAAAGSIATIEARHAGYLQKLVNQPVTENNESFETPLTAQQVANAVAPFVASLNGGPPVTYSQTPSAANDIQILNFALALEYLEAEYYNLNVNRLT